MTFQVILFQTGSWRDLLTRDRLSISISLLALILSFITFWYNYLQKKRETSRGLRKDLTDVIKELIETNILMIKLEQESNGLDNKLIELRRNYNLKTIKKQTIPVDK